FQAISDAMGNFANQGDKVRLAMQIFDTEGVGLVNTFNSNLKKSGDEFERLGMTVTNAQAKSVEAFNDAGSRMGAVWDGFLMQLTANIAPALANLREWFTDLIVQWGGMQEVSKMVGNVFLGVIKAMITGIDYIIRTVKVF